MAHNISALFVDPTGPYVGMGLDCWTVKRDARLYDGPNPVIAHPPCERWGRYWSGGPSAKVRRIKGDDNGCFLSALNSLDAYGGVLEHPEASHAYERYGLSRPPKSGGWVRSGLGWVCCVEQGNYGHVSRKATWILYVNPYRFDRQPMGLIWGKSDKSQRMDEGFHSKEERASARAAGVKPLKRLTREQRVHTPVDFAKVLLKLALSVHR